jgi:NitT/TauT family transport system substrate-binding protein
VVTAGDCSRRSDRPQVFIYPAVPTSLTDIQLLMTLTRRRYLSTVGALSVTGCSALPPGLGGSDGTEVSLLLNWKPSGLHVPYYAAKARGFYEEAGLAVSAITPGDGSDFAARQAGLDNVPFAISSCDQVLNVNSRGLSPVSVGVVMQLSPVVVFATRSGLGEPFTDVGQLAGKRVGTGPGMVRIMTELLLDRADLRSEVDLTDTGYGTVQQLLAGDIDAAGGVFADAVAARANGATVDAIPVAETIPSYGHVVVTSRDYADSNPDAVRSFLSATARGASWARRNPEGGVDALVDANGALAQSRAQQRSIWETLATRFMVSEAVATHGWGWSEPGPWARTATMLAEADFLGGDVDSDAVWTNAYLDTDARYVTSTSSAGDPE